MLSCKSMGSQNQHALRINLKGCVDGENERMANKRHKDELLD
ncbi:unnamed protein product [Musa acuminata subsp. malaccensis]|uniref:(wild Malaysian banana) hypothetical protein n=1 Tax=Musa acuminata subsp. malaccensis TaxID=214687 RepID=A0A804IY72_MUSAM|nr:unnamed protein product [Musa acuminata subsp. malaccensis]